MKWLFWLGDDDEGGSVPVVPAGEPLYLFRTGPWARTLRTGPWVRVFRG